MGKSPDTTPNQRKGLREARAKEYGAGLLDLGFALELGKDYLANSTGGYDPA
jgi:hypothetical protein